MLNVKRFILGEIETNTYVLESNGEFVVIDPAIKSESLMEYLDGKNVKYVLLTHGHFDHIAGVNSIVEKTGAKVLVHETDEELLLDGDKSFYTSHFGAKQPQILADKRLKDSDEIALGDTVIKVMHTPGHTLGSVCYIDSESKTIFSGDTLFKLSAGRTDLAGVSPLKAGRLEIESLQKLASLNGDFTVYPGHGESTTLDYERKYNRYIRSRNASNSN